MSKRPYKRERPVFALKFADGDFEGLEVMARSLPLRGFFEIQKLSAKADEDPEVAEELMHKLAAVLVSWNLVGEDDRPVPPTYDGLVEQDLPFVLAILNAWMDAVTSVPNRSSSGSSAGETSLERSIEMAPL